MLFLFRNLGRVNHLLVFTFEGFEIGRYVTANVQDVHQAILRPSAPYQRSYTRTKQARRKVADSATGEECIIPGEKPLRYINCTSHHVQIAIDSKNYLRPTKRRTNHFHRDSFIPLSTTSASNHLSLYPKTISQWNNLPHYFSTNSSTLKTLNSLIISSVYNRPFL